MEFLERLGDWFTGLTAWVDSFVKRFFGSDNERMIRKIGFVRDKDGTDSIVPGSLLDRIKQLEPEYERLTETELKELTPRFRKRLADGETLDDILPDAFAATREAGKRFLKMRHYDVQMVGGYVLHKGNIAEMVTGEGKTLVSTLPAYLNALAGKVHVVTVNDYLAKRDMEWMGALHIGLGLSVGAIQSQMSYLERQAAYACDITYGTNNELGFDYLRDNMKPRRDMQVQGPLDFAIVDEIDNILIDEARTPLIISGPAHDDITKYPKAHRIAMQLVKDEHFEVKEKEHTCHLTDEGIRRAEELAGVDSFYTAGNMEWPHLIDNSLRAIHLFKKDVTYVVENGEVVIVDEHTGRKMYGRQWSDGLHQAVEAKEGVKIKETTQTLATITLQNFFKLYNKLGGMTGTAMTEASEFYKIYKLDVIAIPTNRPSQRKNFPDVIFQTANEKWNAVVEEIRDVSKTGRPVLVGTASIENSELLSKKLNRFGVKHEVLNAKYHEREAEIISQAGRKGAVTISTNMAGRGTDIILGGNPEHLAWEELKERYGSRLDVPKSEWDDTSARIAEKGGMKEEGKEIKDIGGLYVIGTERHDARRIDLQLRGRAGRQGDPGSSRFFISLEDDLMRIFAGDFVRNLLGSLGMKDGEAIESPMVTRQIEKAQKRREEFHFEQRKNLLEYDEVMDEQRKRVYTYRQRILDGANCRQLIIGMIERQVERAVEHFMSPNYRWETIAAWANQRFMIDVDPSDVRGMEADQLKKYLHEMAVRQAEDEIAEQVEEFLPEEDETQREWNWLGLSRWANNRFNLNTNDKELRAADRDGARILITDKATTMLEKLDFSDVDHLLAEDLGARTTSGWVHQQYGILIDPIEFKDLDPPDVESMIRERVFSEYRNREIGFPVSVGMARFMSRSRSGDQYDRQGLARWAESRFRTQLDPDAIENTSRNDLEEMLRERSRSFFKGEDVFDEVENKVASVYNGHDDSDQERPSPSSLQEIISWANQEFQASLKQDEFSNADREVATNLLLREYDSHYRPEFSQAERMILLEVLDHAWKEHLYFMDHLRSGIGLVSYAQKDPKVEYKREGMKAFDQMWQRVGEQVTAAIFRVETESPDFVGSLWNISSATHAVPDATPVEQTASNGSAPPEMSPGAEPGSTPQTVDPIRNFGDKVGRNDPCPCGSGKKYKKCCGTNE
ncbi:preprotein translocase subunit SecA [Rubinisphaera margarita]|uniref:preprotein translocase subunit SecA n=1 Tax=Rubinisphaera margarita TaxID=2909586 RepID=UPI001EE84A8A|nr:preprotein translocase subunit SecA [Rubinisphaera margarita]MCG6157400.1 preprotein translocase subunit SecA [Rubinisphaera margarita]